jgi:hypothetical protein
LPPFIPSGWTKSVILIFQLTLEERVDRYITSFPKHEKFHGVILAAAGNKVYLHKGYGLASREYIFVPLGMKDTHVENNRTVQNHMATGYMRGLTGFIHAGFEDKSTALAAGDLLTSAQDLYLWDNGMRDCSDKILSAESKKLLYKAIFPGQIYTYGGPVFKIPYDEGKKTLTVNRISGSSTGYSAAMDRIFEPDACVIVLSNVQDAETTRILDHISDFLLRHYLGVKAGNSAPSVLTPSSSVEVFPTDAKKILGFYRNPDGAISGVIRDGGQAISSSLCQGRFCREGLSIDSGESGCLQPRL